MAPAGVSREQLIAKAKTTLAVQSWRLNNLYVIEDKAGRIVPFRMNEAQAHFYRHRWYLNIILKARQLGFSTLIAMLWLDACLFSENTRCGIVDATLDDAKRKLRKIKIAYKHLPQWLKERVPVVSDTATTFEFANGSGVEIGVSHRGGTLQFLHISELGKIAAKHPERAREIRTGALNTVQAGQQVVIESTAEGQGGDFYELCQTAEAKARVKANLTKLDFKFHFYPWHQAAEYALDDDVSVPENVAKYFADLDTKDGIELSPQQKSWYIKKRESQLDDMGREFPSTPEEAFAAKTDGEIFGPWVRTAEANPLQCGHFPAVPGVPVHSFWDIGRSDYNTIWFAQVLFGPRIRVVGYHQDFLKEMPDYAAMMLGTDAVAPKFPKHVFKTRHVGLYKQRGWIKGDDWFPHDSRQTEWGSGKGRLENIVEAGLKPKMVPNQKFHDGIHAARSTLAICEFDAEPTAQGRKMLRGYRWEWDDKRGVFLTGQEPKHDKHSHGGDGFRYLSVSWREVIASIVPQLPDPATLVPTADGRMGVPLPDLIRMRSDAAKQRRW